MMKNRAITVYFQPGFTVIELMVTVAIAVILLTVAVPSLQQVIRDNRVTGQANELIALINLTRNEAVRRGIDSNDDDRAILRLDSTASGWSGNVSVTDGDTADGCPVGVVRCSDNSDVTLTTTTNELSFESRGYLDKAVWDAEFICLKHVDPCMGNRQHTRITVLASGQVETESVACGDPCDPGGD